MAAPAHPWILLVNSDSSTRQQLAEILRNARHAVVEASNAHEALEPERISGAWMAVLATDLADTDVPGLSQLLRQKQPGLCFIAIGDDAAWADCSLEMPVLPEQLRLAARILQRQQRNPPAILMDAGAHADTLGTIAHDLRNALAPLRSAIAILTRTGHVDPSRKPVLAMMEKQVGQMVGLIDRLSDEARRVEGKPAATPTQAMDAPCAPELPANGERGRVLVADDSDAVRDSVGALLRSQGYEVRTASDGLEALETAGSWLPDFVFVDMRMPRLDGFGLARRLRADFPGRAMKIILMSGISLDAVLVRHAMAAGFDVCIDKVSPPEQWFVHLQHS